MARSRRKTRKRRGPDDIPDLLAEIVSKLDVLISLTCRPLGDYKEYEGREDSVQHRILELCDYQHTVEDMAVELNKEPNHIRKEIFRLVRKGNIVKVTREGRLVYVRR